MMIKRRTIILLVALVYFNLNAIAQIDVKLKITPDTLNMGQDVEIYFEIATEGSIEIEALQFNVFDSLALARYLYPDDSLMNEGNIIPVDFEIKDYGSFLDSGTNLVKPKEGKTFEKDQKGKIINKLVFKIWDPGHFLMIIDEIKYVEDGKASKTFKPDVRQSALLYVNGPDALKGEETDISPIKDILREGWHWLDFKWLYIAIAAIGLIVFLMTRPKRKRRNVKKAIAEKIIIRPADEIAIEKLDALKNEGLWQKGEIKSFQSELSFIVREYLENRFKIKALESTTGEILDDLSHTGMIDSDVKRLSDLLQIADLVKFAKAKPADSIHAKFLDYAYEFILNTKMERIEAER